MGDEGRQSWRQRDAGGRGGRGGGRGGNEEKENEKHDEHFRIEENSIGNSYNSLFGKFLDESVKIVNVEDPYIRSNHQVVNFLKLCELMVRKCPKLLKIYLLTRKDNEKAQESKLLELKQSLGREKIVLEWEFSSTLHDREIRLDSGWIIKLGRGLDIFKPPEGKMVLGYFDMDLRKCLETTVDIFFNK